MAEKNKKYPKSINNLQCLGPCYYKDVTIFHPTQNSYVTQPYSFCPTEAHNEENPISGQIEKHIVDKCINPTHKKDVVSIPLVTPISEFTKQNFLQIYGIHSIEECFVWLSNNVTIPIQTKARVVDATLNVYGKEIQFANDIFIDFFYDYIKKEEITEMYELLHSYIDIQKDTVLLVKKTSLAIDEYRIERINFIISNLVTVEYIKNFLVMYIQKYDNWENINNNLHLMITKFTEYIISKIKKI